MRKAERLSAILARASGAGSVDAAELATALGVSGATIRRDLQSLSADRLLLRTHGGAVAPDGEELSVRVKATRAQAEKARIGRAAAELVPDGAVIGMTGGSTALALALALGDRRGITVVTNALDIATALVGRPSLRLVVVGGFARPSNELVGPAAQAMLANYHLDVAFIGVDGLTSAEGCTTHDEMEAETDRCFLDRAERSVVIADSSKLGRVTFARIAPLAAVDDVVTDDAADPDQLRGLEDSGTRVRLV